MRDVLPGFEEGSQLLEQEFFQVVPQVNVLLQRMECLYAEQKVALLQLRNRQNTS